MSDDLVIRAEGLGKRYWVGHETERERYVALRDVLARTARNAWRKTRDLARGRDIIVGDTIEEFWALKGLNFEVRRGEVLGIIGRNGAGKSTLLKILSRITEPSEGRVTIKGRVASLLEVGTGFHPELTGRENIFLNGAILGMTRASIKRKFDEIVAFSEVEKFLDTPVKRYSSGMYVRLAFGVAAHLEPEILIVDEVLAVGDAEFQKKCLGKMSEVAGGGRTVLFVSHNMSAIENLCDRALLLSHGSCVADGPVGSVLQEYTQELAKLNEIPLHQRKDRRGTGILRFVSMSLEQNGKAVSTVMCGNDAALNILLENKTGHDLRGVNLSLGIDNEFGQRIALLDTELADQAIPAMRPGRHTVRALIPKMPLNPGRYFVTFFSTANGDVADWITHGAVFDVDAGDFYGTGRLPPAGQCLFLTTFKFTADEQNTGTLDAPKVTIC